MSSEARFASPSVNSASSSVSAAVKSSAPVV